MTDKKNPDKDAQANDQDTTVDNKDITPNFSQIKVSLFDMRQKLIDLWEENDEKPSDEHTAILEKIRVLAEDSNDPEAMHHYGWMLAMGEHGLSKDSETCLLYTSDAADE